MANFSQGSGFGAVIASINHRELPAQFIHISQSYNYTDAAARLAATGFLPEDVGRIAFQEDIQTLWVLVDDSPITWKELTNTSDIVSSFTVAASTSEELHRISLTNLCGVKYTICMYNVAEDKYRTLEILGSRLGSSDVTDTLYAMVGNSMDVDLDFSVDSGDAVLEATNNESYDVTVRITKAII